MGCKVGAKIISWSSEKYTTEQMSREIYSYLCNKRNRSVTYFENEVKRMISNGPPTRAELNYKKCDCLNKSQIKGVCKLGACVEIIPNGWTVTINVETVIGNKSIGSLSTGNNTGAGAGTSSPSGY